MVAVIPSYIASCQINVVKPLTALAERGLIKFQHVLEHQASPSHIRWADLVVFCRNTEPAFRHLLSEAKGRRRPIIYDIDDSFWDISNATDPDLARYHLQALRIQQFERYLSHASLVRAYSPLLEAKVARFNHNVGLYRSSFDFSQLPGRKSKRHATDKLGIVYATSRTVDDQYKIFLPALADFLKDYSSKVEFTVWGCAPADLLAIPGVVARKLVPGYNAFLREFVNANFQIGLAPLEDNEFNRSKNNTKFRDYGACGIAGIYSNLDVYSSSVSNQINGLLVENTRNSWYQAMCRLVDDETLRKTIIENAAAKVFHDHRQELIEDEWLQDIHTLLADVPSWWLSKLKNADTINIEIRPDMDELCGVELTAPSGLKIQDNEKVFVEIQSASGTVLRELVVSVVSLDLVNRRLSFAFPPVRNSKNRQLKLRISGLTREVQAGQHEIGENICLRYQMT